MVLSSLTKQSRQQRNPLVETLPDLLGHPQASCRWSRDLCGICLWRKPRGQTTCDLATPTPSWRQRWERGWEMGASMCLSPNKLLSLYIILGTIPGSAKINKLFLLKAPTLVGQSCKEQREEAEEEGQELGVTESLILPRCASLCNPHTHTPSA